MTTTVLVCDGITKDGIEPLVNLEEVNLIFGKLEEIQELETINGLMVRSATKVTEAVLEKLPGLKIIARAGVGVDNIDVAAATKKGILVVNAPEGNTISTAEHTWAMMMSLLRNIPQANQSLKTGEWNRKKYTGQELYQKTLGIVGMGRIGSELAKRAKSFSMNVLVFDPYFPLEKQKELSVTSVDLDTLIQQSDIITVHTPLTKDTRKLLNADNLKHAKRGAFILNCARGGIIDEEALLHFLDNGHLAGCALDVFEQEPPVNRSLIEHENVVVTPHIAASTVQAQKNVAFMASDEIKSFILNKPLKHAVNFPSLSKDTYEKLIAYYDFSNDLGSFTTQFFKEPVQEISIGYGGSLSEIDTTPLTRSFLCGFLRTRLGRPVNDVNSMIAANERGIVVGEKHGTDDFGYPNIIHVKVTGQNHTFTLSATLVKGFGGRIIRLNGYTVDFVPQGSLLYIEHQDTPGIIGKVGAFLGERNINIATMHVGRKSAGGEAMMVLTFDSQPSENIQKELSNIEDLIVCKPIEL
ncbi:phosphoglycerate dehydrogenase [Fictibacillus barbaricus]|uniref:D-3-phosphoglycerate dehydrogenase n=1 Tax=Fictibacillus barbaricus TaxID=182136 RepID=A0ABU1TZD7_9BACL|nr:phosphoglycerate dehydrogenase [Fictibacillus barbaricus]MDR7072580.1 D-3-phosphoglycerate dehydrogenase [Fictibacillus barbaricus]